jgi:hypothetical protein
VMCYSDEEDEEELNKPSKCKINKCKKWINYKGDQMTIMNEKMIVVLKIIYI